MSVLKFYPLKVKEITPETSDCVSVALEVPEELQEIFKFAPGQYLTFKKHLNDTEIRRSYSICVSPNENELRVAVKRVDQGKFSGFANQELKVGELLDVMPPMGKFSPRKTESKKRNYLAFVAGSGITPVMSIMKTVLQNEPDSQFTLVYGNKNRNTIIFRETIEGLKNMHMQNLRVYHVLSRELMDVPLFNGRIDAEKVKAFCSTVINVDQVDEVFICGPEEMLMSVRQQLQDLGVPTEKLHIELFTSPDQPKPTHDKWVKEHKSNSDKTSQVSITLDGATFEMELGYNSDSILDAALKSGADLPYACKGGVCSTCRAKVTAGEVIMETNYALEKDEVAKGFILTCQSHPVTERVVVDFDAR
ncbi:MAG TPA: 1,2-phenylacetyl-CoA epoxidase subunit PaaE [Flavipsychrobacter sp.]|nr:1,2-phenylacetyl-CoA epoxidase subunit PaaE [Flavipsychrobacter sp.]